MEIDRVISFQIRLDHRCSRVFPPSTMSAPNPSLIPASTKPTAPPKNDPFTAQSLAAYNGTDSSLPIYVAVKGTVFDVTPNAGPYAPGAKYSVFAGKDGSKALGIPSVKAEDIVPDYSGLNADQLKTLDGWYNFFAQRYNIVGKVVG